MTDNKTLKLTQNLATRESARILFKKVLGSNITNLDFSDVKVISRSFANEFINLEKEYNLKISKDNMSKEVKKMIQTADMIFDNDILSKENYKTVSVSHLVNLI